MLDEFEISGLNSGHESEPTKESTRRNSLDEVAAKIKRHPRKQGSVVIAVSGFGGSGKTTVANEIAELLEDAVVVSLDDFFLDRLRQRSADWASYDWQRLIDQMLRPTKERATSISYDVYDWGTNRLGPKRKLDLPSYVIIEGVGLLRNGMDEYFDHTIWVDVPLELAIERGKRRDRDQYGVDHDALWEEVWGPNDSDYFHKHLPDQTAEYLVSNE